jgi:hypothetical protein
MTPTTPRVGEKLKMSRFARWETEPALEAACRELSKSGLASYVGPHNNDFTSNSGRGTTAGTQTCTRVRPSRIQCTTTKLSRTIGGMTAPPSPPPRMRQVPHPGSRGGRRAGCHMAVQKYPGCQEEITPWVWLRVVLWPFWSLSSRCSVRPRKPSNKKQNGQNTTRSPTHKGQEYRGSGMGLSSCRRSPKSGTIHD